MKILITGSNGFIGSYFIRNYNDRYEFQKFSFLRDDFSALELNGIDTVLHLSALVHQMGGASEEEYEKINVTQTIDLAKKAKQSGVNQFVFMSSVKVYGEESENIYTETSECHPEDSYGKSKLRAEHQLQELEDERFKVSIIRTPIVYGYGVKANIRNLITLIKKSPILPILGTNNKRSMVYIGNLSHLVHEVILQNQRGIFLAADDFPLSTMELMNLIAKKLDKKVYFVKIPFLETILKYVKPSFYKRLYKNLEVNNDITKKKLSLSNPYLNEEGIQLTLKMKKLL
jgi:nucleoside-diphosphate-sugar epimerase